MHTITTGRSPITIAEDLLLEAATKVFNMSEAEATRTRTQLRELGHAQRVQAEALLAEWEGTDEQRRKAHDLARVKRFAICEL